MFYFSDAFYSAICLDEIRNECLVLREAILFSMPSETRQAGDLKCLISETKPYFYANIPAPTLVSTRQNWQGNNNPFEEMFDGKFFYDTGYANTFQRAKHFDVSWYCMDLGPTFTPPATIVLYGGNKQQDYYSTNTAPVTGIHTNSLTGKLPPPTMETERGMNVQRVFVDATYAGNRFFTIAALDRGHIYVGLINIEPH